MGSIKGFDWHDEDISLAQTREIAGQIVTGAVNCKGTRFPEGADFTGARFLGGDVRFDGAVFLGNVSFADAKFGQPYERFFGDWEIWFEEWDKKFFLKRRKKGENVEVSECHPVSPKWPDTDEFASGLADSLDRFKKNPGTVSFADCRFGAMALNGFSGETLEEIRTKESTEGLSNKESRFSVFERFVDQAPVGDLTPDQETSIMRILSRHLDRAAVRRTGPENVGVDFSRARFYNRGIVDFENALFLNGGHVQFDSASWSNGGDVRFSSCVWANGGDVWFNFATWANGRDVGFDFASWANDKAVKFGGASWENKKDVSFKSSSWCNNGGVGFSKASWSNDGDINFNDAMWVNGKGLSFRWASWNNGGKLHLHRMIVGSLGDASFTGIKFGSEKFGAFTECLFLCGGNVTFRESRFPKNGAFWFQRCYLAPQDEVDFTGAFIRHTMFEGGEIGWLKRPKDASKNNEEYQPPLSKRLGEKYAGLPEKVKERLDSFQSKDPEPSPVFEKGVEVWWKDLTTESARHLTLRRCNLSHSLFDGMTLSHVQLNAPEWLEQDSRLMLWAEAEARKNWETVSPGTLRDIEDQYTQLKNNLERQGNYLHAGDFHYGEQEVRRKKLIREPPWWRLITNSPIYCLSILYKWSSGYGERPERAVLMTLLLAVGLTIYNGRLPGFMGVENTGFFSEGKTFFKVLLHSLSPFSFKVVLEKGFITSTNWFHYTVFFFWQIILLGIQLPLLVMAVRRRFKR